MSVSVHDGLRSLARPSALWELPAGGLFHRETLDEDSGRTSSGSYRSQDGRIEATLTSGGRRLHLELGPSPLDEDMLLENAWVARFTVRRTEQRFGAHPATTPLGEERLWLALLPLSPAQIGPEPDTSDEPVPISLDSNALIELVATGLEHRARVDAEVVRSILDQALDPDGAPAWMAVFCDHDGAGEFGVLPLRIDTDLTNARSFCAALHALIP